MTLTTEALELVLSHPLIEYQMQSRITMSMQTETNLVPNYKHAWLKNVNNNICICTNSVQKKRIVVILWMNYNGNKSLFCML